jgi:hypothetical protein
VDLNPHTSNFNEEYIMKSITSICVVTTIAFTQAITINLVNHKLNSDLNMVSYTNIEMSNEKLQTDLIAAGGKQVPPTLIAAGAKQVPPTLIA